MFISSRVMCDGPSTGPGCLVIAAGLPAANRQPPGGGAKMIRGAMATPGVRSSRDAVAYNGRALAARDISDVVWQGEIRTTTGQLDVQPYKC